MGDLDMLIADFEELIEADFEKEIKEAFAEIMKQIGIRTINDTNQAKGVFVDATMKAFGIDISDVLGVNYNFWKNNRAKSMGDFEFTYNKNGKDVEFEMKTDDIAIYMMEKKGMEASRIHSEGTPDGRIQGTGRDNSKFQPYMITKVCDSVNAGTMTEVNQKIEKFLDKIMILLEG